MLRISYRRKPKKSKPKLPRAPVQCRSALIVCGLRQGRHRSGTQSSPSLYLLASTSWRSATSCSAHCIGTRNEGLPASASVDAKFHCFRLMFYYLAWMVGKMLTHHLAGVNMLTHKASMDRDDLLSIPTQKLRERPPKILFEDLHGSSMVISTTRLPQTSIALRSRFQDFLRQSQSALE